MIINNYNNGKNDTTIKTIHGINVTTREKNMFHNPFETIKIYDNDISGKTCNNEEKRINDNTNILEEKFIKKVKNVLVKLVSNHVHETRKDILQANAFMTTYFSK